MRKSILIAAVVFTFAGCNSYKHFMGRDHEGSGENNPGTLHRIASVGVLPASNALTFAPSFDVTESIQSVKVRILGVLTDVSDVPSGGLYYSFDGSVLTIHNYTAAGNDGGFSDNFAVYYLSPFPAGYHTVN